MERPNLSNDNSVPPLFDPGPLGGTTAPGFDPGPVGGAQSTPSGYRVAAQSSSATTNPNRIFLFVGIGVVVIVAAVAAIMLSGNKSDPTTTTGSGGAGTYQGSSGSSGGSGGYVSPTPVQLPAGAVACSQSGSGTYSHSARGTDITSCPFADAVRDAVRSSGGSFPRTVMAYSPVTHMNYSMACSGSELVTCRGGNDAVVYVY